MRPLSSWPTSIYASMFAAVFLGSTLAVYLFLARTPAPLPHIEPAQIVPRASQPVHAVIGRSVEGRSIDAYTFSVLAEPAVLSRENSLAERSEGNRGLFREKGTVGDAYSTLGVTSHVIFVGGIHGGYEWNSVALAYKALDHLTKNPSLIPPGTQVTIIPNLNPDAVYAALGLEGQFSEDDAQHALVQLGKRYSAAEKTTHLESARFNANKVDLNRNFACNWQPKSTWKSRQVSAGEKVFSEPEAHALKTFVEKQLHVYAPDELSFIFWHSQANAVYASQCGSRVLPATSSLMGTYAKAAGYKAVATFDAYPVTGAAEDWLASLGIPAITVELSSHTSLDWDKNLAGITAVLLTPLVPVANVIH